MRDSRSVPPRPGRLMRRLRLVGRLGLLGVALTVVVFLVWAHTPRVAERAAADEVYANPAVSVTDTPTGVVLAPRARASGVGLVFLPGARIDPYAFLFALAGTVERTGLTVVIAKPTLNLAILDGRPLSAFTAAAPGIAQWYVGGHSLGGVRACQYAADSDVAGLVIFGSYCATSLADTELRVLSLFGSEDALTTPRKVRETAALLPADTRFVEIEGANHARFGAYGVEDGDGVATASPHEVAAVITRELSAYFAR